MPDQTAVNRPDGDADGEVEARVAELETERPRFSQRRFVEALRDRDEAQSRAAELAERVPELEAERDLWRDRAEKGQMHRDDLIRERARLRTHITELGGEPIGYVVVSVYDDDELDLAYDGMFPTRAEAEAAAAREILRGRATVHPVLGR